MNELERTDSVRGSTVRNEVRVGERPFLTTGLMLLVLSVSLNVFLALRLHKLTHARSDLITSMKADRQLRRGAVVPPITAKHLDGKEGVISYEDTGQPTVLYVFTPPCLWCARNIDNFKTLMGKEGNQYRFIGLSLSDAGLTEYLTKNELRLSVYSGLSPETLKTYKLGSTPQTIVISTGGVVLQDWVGAYVGDQKSQVEAFFQVSLPGLREIPKADAAKN